MYRNSKKKNTHVFQTKQRFSIKKLNFGVASVLIGLTFLGTRANADEINDNSFGNAPGSATSVVKVHGDGGTTDHKAENDEKNQESTEETNVNDKKDAELESNFKENNSDKEHTIVPYSSENLEVNSVDVSNGIKSTISITGVKDQGANTVNTVTPHDISGRTEGKDSSLKVNVDFEYDKNLKPGDYFDLKLSPNVDNYGISKDNIGVQPIYFNDQILAEGNKISNDTYRYTFTKTVNDVTDIKGHIELPIFINKDVVPNSSSQIISASIGNTLHKLPIYVDYSKNVGPSDDPNGVANIDGWDLENKEITYTAYYNPNGAFLNNRRMNVVNLPGSRVKFDSKALDSVRVYKLRPGGTLSESFAIDDKKLEDVTDQVEKRIEKDNALESPEYLSIYLGRNYSRDKYVIQFTANYDGGTEEDPHDIHTRGVMQGSDSSWTWDNAITIFSGHNSGEAKDKTGSFQEHHIYITKDQDGVEVSRDVVNGAVSEGRKTEEYTTGKVDKAGYHFVRTETPVNEPTYNEDGSSTKGHYVPNTKQEITYVYEKSIVDPQKQPGNFQEHHIYITKDQDGVEVSREVVDGAVTEGRKNEEYTTGKVDKDGYRFVKTEKPVNDPTYNKDGSSTKGHYVPNTKQEITYVYEKTIDVPPTNNDVPPTNNDVPPTNNDVPLTRSRNSTRKENTMSLPKAGESTVGSLLGIVLGSLLIGFGFKRSNKDEK